MKLTAIFFSMMAVALAADQKEYKVPAEIFEEIKRVGIPCAVENNVDQSLLLRVANGSIPDDEASLNFLNCFTLNSGFTTADGHMVPENLATVVKGHPLETEFKNAIAKCNEVTKETPMATLLAMHRCFASASPIRLLF